MGVCALAAAALAFLPALGNGFWQDDFGFVARAMEFCAGQRAWTDLTATNFRPLSGITFALNYALGGIAPAGYHAFNVALHVAVVALVMALARRLGGSRLAAGVAGLLFAVGFGHWGDAVIWVSGRTGPLADLFVLAALVLHWDALERGGAWRRAASVACFALALMAKETAATALPLLVLLEWVWRGRRQPAPAWGAGAYVPYAALLAAFLLYEFAVFRRGSHIVGTDYVIGPHALGALVDYLARMFLPVDPASAAGAAPARALGALRAAFIALEIVVPAAWLALIAHPRVPRAVKFGVLWMPITVLPVCFLAFRTITRYLYEPAVGLALVAGIAAAALWARASASPRSGPARTGLAAALAALLLAQAAVTQAVIHRRRHDEIAQAGTRYGELRAEQARLARPQGGLRP